ncbi:putative ribonuclease H-like domain-containing protein [Tanacetum coccineum]
MTGNKAYLAEYQDYNGGPITFGGSKGYITGKGKIKTGKLDFKDTECLVLSSDFKLPDENQVFTRIHKTAGPKEANHSAGTQDNIDAGNSEMEAESAQDYFVLPIWSSYTSTVKSSEAKNEGEKPNKNTGLKTNEEPVDQEDQAFLEELERLKRQEKEANDAAEALRKEFAQDTEDLLLQAGAARATSTNTVNTASTPVSTASPSGGLSYPDLTYTDQDDSQIPALEDIYDNPNDGIFTNASYDDEGAVTDFTNLETIMNVSPIPTSRIHSIHPSTQILGDPKSAVQTRSKVNKSSGAHAFKISEALEDESWVDAMQEELLQFKIQKVWILVDLPYGKKAIGTKWFYKTKKDERGFVDPKFPKKVYKVVKALYGLHQAPRAWYATLSTFLLKSGYRRGTIDKTLFIKKDKNDIMLVQVYVDDIIFGSTKRSWCDEFEALMKSRFQMSSMGELTFFLTASNPIETQKPLTKDEEADDVNIHLYRSMIGSLMYLTASRPDIISILMASLKFVDQHNMVACLEKSEENIEFHQIVDFFSTCSINYALTGSSNIRIISKEFFLMMRMVLLALQMMKFFENLALMGYEQLSTKLTFQKGSFSPQWKFLIHTILHCISLKSTDWNEFSTNLASAVICLAKGQKFNFSKLIFDGMLRNLDPKKFLMYPRFLQLFLNNQLKDLPEPFNDTYKTPCHTKKVFTNMARKGVKFSGKVTPLFDSMLVPHQAPEGEGSKQPTEPQPTPSPTHPNTGDQPPVTDSSSSHDTTQEFKDSLEDTNGSERTQVQSSHDSPLSGDHTFEKAEGGLNLEELFVLCTNLSNRVLALKTSKDA